MKGFHQTKAKDWKDGVKCPYCGNQAKWCSNEEVYGRRYGKSYMCYWCKDCDAYVGCHQNSRKPLGTMANKALRKLRMETHALIDPLWKNGGMSRRAMYQKLSVALGYDVHVGSSNEQECRAIMRVISEGYSPKEEV